MRRLTKSARGWRSRGWGEPAGKYPSSHPSTGLEKTLQDPEAPACSPSTPDIRHCSAVPAISRQREVASSRLQPPQNETAASASAALGLWSAVWASALIGWARAWTWPLAVREGRKECLAFSPFLGGKRIPQTMERGSDAEWPIGWHMSSMSSLLSVLEIWWFLALRPEGLTYLSSLQPNFLPYIVTTDL